MKSNHKLLFYFIVAAGWILAIVWTLLSFSAFFILFSMYGEHLLSSLFLHLGLLLGLYLPLTISAGLIKISRKIIVLREGIVVKYPFHKEVTVKWTDIGEVSIGYFFGSGYIGDDPKPCVFFVRNGVKKGYDGRPKLNSPFYIFKVYAVSYSSEFYGELIEKCPIEVVDKRNTLLYKEYWDRDKNRES